MWRVWRWRVGAGGRVCKPVALAAGGVLTGGRWPTPQRWGWWVYHPVALVGWWRGVAGGLALGLASGLAGGAGGRWSGAGGRCQGWRGR